MKVITPILVIAMFAMVSLILADSTDVAENPSRSSAMIPVGFKFAGDGDSFSKIDTTTKPAASDSGSITDSVAQPDSSTDSSLSDINVVIPQAVPALIETIVRVERIIERTIEKQIPTPPETIVVKDTVEIVIKDTSKIEAVPDIAVPMNLTRTLITTILVFLVGASILFIATKAKEKFFAKESFFTITDSGGKVHRVKIDPRDRERGICPYCGESVKENNFLRHLSRVHPEKLSLRK